jgi:hypothetical protein
VAKGKALIIHMQLLVINNQHIQDVNGAAVSSDVGGIHLCRNAECTPCIAESKLLCYLLYLGAMVDFPLIVQSLLRGSIY